MIALIDYGAGNLTSVRKAVAALGAELMTPTTPAALTRARGVIVPGVGNFDATRAIDEEWRRAIRAAVDRGAALFGICLGMQWLFEGSVEAPDVAGFGVFDGVCGRLLDKDPTPLDSALGTPHAALGTPHAALGTPHAALGTPHAALGSSHSALRTPHSALKIPHVGWNSLSMPHASTLLAGVAEGAQVYFTHSYAAPPSPYAAAITTYGSTFTAAVERDRIAGVQFHPEKSGDVGLRILANWLTSI